MERARKWRFPHSIPWTWMPRVRAGDMIGHCSPGVSLLQPAVRMRPSPGCRGGPRLPFEHLSMTNIEELKSTGLKATLPRLKILEVFQNAKQRHMTAEDVFRVLLDERSDIGLATVYRVLMQFEQAGLLTRSNFESGKAVYELNEGQHHDHLVCLDCGRVEEFFDAEIEKRQQIVAKSRGFKLQEHALSLYANCTKTDCPNRNAKR
jgi:Fur family transcriptional regulator, ferric uptake regulator